jgi:putative ABC transport system permease protein
MIIRLTFAGLRRHRSRTALTVAGVAVAAAMLLDMVMLGSGMRASFRDLIGQQGFQLRLAPRGTMPFDSDALIGGASALTATLKQNPDITTIAPILGSQLVTNGVTVFALGLDPKTQGDYTMLSGRDAAAANDLVVNDNFLNAVHAKLGDTLHVSAGYDAQLRAEQGAREMVLVGRARFNMLPGAQIAAALHVESLQAMGGERLRDKLSVILVRTRDGADVEAVRKAIDATVPRVTAYSTEAALKQVDQRLSYFRQLAFILASVSLIVGFLLVTTLMTVSVNERIGEIAVMRAIGVARHRVVQQVVFEGAIISLTGSVLGLGLGLVTGRWLNSILASFPGLPAAFDFFRFEPSSAYRALGLLTLCGIAAGVLPSWRAARLPIAHTLREEAVA